MGLAETAKKLIEKHGQSFTLTRKNQGAYVPGSSGDYADSSTQTFSGIGFPEDFSAKDIDDSRVKGGDIKFHVAQLSTTFKPEPDDLVETDGKKFTVIRTLDYLYERSSVLYTLHLRIGI